MPSIARLQFVETDLVRQRRIDRGNPALLAQFDCKKAAYPIMGCGGRQVVYCPGFHQYLLCSWWCVDTETVALALRRACIGSITIKRRRDRTPKVQSRNSDPASLRAAIGRSRKSAKSRKPPCFPSSQLGRSGKRDRPVKYRFSAVPIFWPYRNDEALRLFYRAVERDSDFSAAYAAAAGCLSRHKGFGWGIDGEQEAAEAKRLARRAMQS